MASLTLKHIYKVYENGHKAVNDFNIDIQDKEFIVFVGPSGCGKSTTLRMIAGLEEITAGDLFIGDTLVNDMEPKDRDIAMVFQNYALYPHMSVYENMAFGLRNRKVPEEEIKRKVTEAAKILDITDYLDRKPKAMSGGQRQRVALGRAIVRDPKVFLLDEPLSNLDAKLRAQMRTEITKLHKSLGTTFIYVTHDQVEAMTMGTRIVVMKLGYVQQIDTPMNLYNKPYNKFVAGFIGTPQMNFFTVRLNRVKDQVEIIFQNGNKVLVPYETVAKAPDKYLHGEVEVILGIRPDHVAFSKNKTLLSANVSAVEHLGNECIVYADLEGAEAIQQEEKKDEDDMSKSNSITIKTIEGTPVEVGEKIYIELNPEKIHLFDKETEITILEDIPHASAFEGKLLKSGLKVFGATNPLPGYVAKALEGKEEVLLEIPPFAVVPGNDYTLKVHNVEEIDGKRLAALEVGDRYLYAIVDKKVKKGEDYSFSLYLDKVKFVANGEAILEPIGEEEELVGTFGKIERRENKERIIDFHYNINGVLIEAPRENGFKMNAVEGNKCYKNNYKYVVNRRAINVVEEGGIPASVVEILDYGHVSYAKLDVAGQELLIELAPGQMVEGDIQISFAGEDVAVHSLDIDMRIC